MFANLNSNQQQFFNQQTNNIEIAYSQQYFNTNNNNHNFNNHHNQQQQHLPSCIVIGCKNSYSNSSVKYYQVPLLTDNNSNNIARQWYINTLREDLLDFVLSSNSNTSTTTNNNNGLKLDLLPTPHYVCIEHFDEESFNNNTTTANEQIIILKDDAVPSLFEIEVFQKMIAHQEQIALNQQKQLIQLNNQQKQQQQQTTIPVKRARMDPDTRAALIQRVPKAVKRTSLLSMALQPPPPPQQVTTPKPIITPTITQPQQIKAPKAVKHTSLRYNDPSLINRIETNNTKQPQQQQQQTTTTTTPTPTPKLPKALKHPSANILLPPPIMQSTKRANKAIKHTGGGSNAYYQSNKQLQPNNNQQPLTQLNLNNDLTKSTPVVAATIQPATNVKMPTTTTYVYKRILQQPEIDLNLDCEDEEIILLSAPSSPIPPPPPPPVPELVHVEPELPNRNQTDDLKLNIVKKLKNSLLNNNSESNKTEIKRAINTTVAPGGDGVKKKNKVGRKKKIIIDSTSESSDIDDLEIDENELIDEDELDDENDYIDDDDDDDDDDYLDDDDDDYEEPVRKKLNTSKRNSLIKTPTNTNNLLNVPTLNANYAELLSKFYSRSLGSSNNSETESSSKRTKYSNKIAKDLIVGNYPAKVSYYYAENFFRYI